MHLDRQASACQSGLQAKNCLSHALSLLTCWHTHVDLRPALGSHDVRPRAAADYPNVDGYSPARIIERR